MVPADRISLVHRILTLPDLMITLSFKEDIIRGGPHEHNSH